MTATVVSLDSRRPPSCGCARHRLEALVTRSAAVLASTEGELMVDRQALARLVDDLTESVEAALANNERTNP